MVAHANQQRSVIYYNKANEQQIKVREREEVFHESSRKQVYAERL